MRVLVTGAGGFVGRHCIAALRAAGCAVTGLLGPGDRHRPVAERLVEGEMGDATLLAGLLAECDAVVHGAGPAAVADSFADPALFARVHVAGTALLAGLARARGVRRFLLVSSAEVYGAPSANPVAETASLAPISPYGAAKLGAEWQARTLLADMPGRLTILRPFSLYGPGMRETSVLGRIVDAVRSERPVALQTLRPERDYLHIADFAALVAALVAAPEPPLIVNACSGTGISVGDLARLALSLAGRDEEPEDLGAAARPTDVVRLVGDPAVALGLGWAPQVTLAQGIAGLIG